MFAGLVALMACGGAISCKQRLPEIEIAPLAEGLAGSHRITETSLGAFRYRCARPDGSLGDEREQPTTVAQSRDPGALERIAAEACKGQSQPAEARAANENGGARAGAPEAPCAVRMRLEGETAARCFDGLLQGPTPSHYAALAEDCRARGRSFVGVVSKDCRQAARARGAAGTESQAECSQRKSYVCGEEL